MGTREIKSNAFKMYNNINQKLKISCKTLLHQLGKISDPKWSANSSANLAVSEGKDNLIKW